MANFFSKFLTPKAGASPIVPKKKQPWELGYDTQPKSVGLFSETSPGAPAGYGAIGDSAIRLPGLQPISSNVAGDKFQPRVQPQTNGSTEPYSFSSNPLAGLMAPKPATPPSPTIPKKGVASAAIPAAGAGGPSNTALDKLKLEAENMAKYGDARGPQPKPFLQGFAPEKLITEMKPSNTTTVSELDRLMANRDKTGLTPDAIQSAEDVRRADMAAAIERSYGSKRQDQEQINAEEKRVAELLGYNYSGGLGSVSETQTNRILGEMRKGRDLLAELETQKQDALASNDTTFAQRIEDRQAALAERERLLAKDYQDRIKQASDTTEQDRRFNLDVAGEDRNRAYALAQIDQMDKTSAQSAVKDLLDTYGSKAFDGVDQQGVANIEVRAGLPKGSLQMARQTIDEAKGTEQKFIEGSKYQKSGVFNPMTGAFVPLAEAYIASADADKGSGLNAQELAKLKEAYLTQENKAAYLTKLPDKYRIAIMSDPTMMVSKISDTLDSDRAKELVMTGEYIKAMPDEERANVEADLTSAGVDVNDKNIKALLDQSYNKGFFSNFFGG